MPIRYDITHTTVYRYQEPVRFGEHRVVFRPRDSHDLRVLATDLQVSPAASVRMIQDPYSNSVALVQPLTSADRLSITCSFKIEHAHSYNLELPLTPSAELYPFAYSLADRFDLEHYLRPHYDDPQGKLTAWSRQFLSAQGPTFTRQVLVEMNRTIRSSFTYSSRDEEGTQSPLETLEHGSGSCRDFALLMMEAARRLGIATRFVSGYLYDPALDAEERPADSGADAANTVVSTAPVSNAPAAAPVPTVGAGATHAWMQAYLPGAGWVPFDPTNNLLGGTQLIRVAVARDPNQAAPVSGSWFGDADAYIGMEVSVKVRRIGPRDGG
jgi:transglutaminase-like putative cysteine protease